MSVDVEFNYIIDYFFDEKLPVSVYSGKSGYNNSTRYLERNGRKYILRIYETHNDERKVKLEHEVLLKLNQLVDLPFKIPVPVLNNGVSIVRLPSNKIGCVYHYVEGDNPVFSNSEILHSFGESVAQLLHGLQRIRLEQPFLYRPYYEIEHAHPNCPIIEVMDWCKNPPDSFREYREELSWISKQLVDFKGFVPHLMELPHQIIHGDLNASNILVGLGSNTINAILDFEFTTWDLRVMEVAVCISDIISEEKEEVYLEKIQHFFTGYAIAGDLTVEEQETLPVLIQLRRLDVFLHFLGRYLDGKDNAAVLEEQIVKAASYEQWLNGGGQKVVRLWKEVKGSVGS